MEIAIALIILIGTLGLGGQRSREAHVEKMAKAGMCEQVQGTLKVWQQCRASTEVLACKPEVTSARRTAGD